MQSDKNKIYGVILAGGEGQRLWPLSRIKSPKYCISVSCDNKSLLQSAYDRLKKITATDKIYVVTQKKQARLIQKQLPLLNKRNIIVEPFAKNTASAVALAALVIKKRSPEAVMVIVPADQYMYEKSGFKKAISSALNLAQERNALVTIGIKPTYPATGFGYIKGASLKACKVDKFIEKPDLKKAKKLMKAGCLWNSGIFIWKAAAILQAIKSCAPNLYRKLSDYDCKRISLENMYKAIDKISIDYAVLEKSGNIYVVPSDIKWDDVGSWLSFSRIKSKDKNGNVIDAAFCGIDTQSCIIMSKDKRHLIATYGLKNVVIVNTPDATLVCSKDSAEKIKDLVNVSDGSFR